MTRRKAKPSTPAEIAARRCSPDRSTNGANDNRPAVANDHETPRAVVIMLEDVPVVSRRAWDDLTDSEAARLLRIKEAALAHDRRTASRLALEFERAHGITAEDRITALQPANDIDAALDRALALALETYAETYTPPPQPKKAKRPKGVKKPKPPKIDPLAGLIPGDLTQDEIDRLAKAEVGLKSADAEVRDRAKRNIDTIQRAAEKRRLDASLAAARTEVYELERLRDPSVVIGTSSRPEHKGRLEISNRDGLEALWVEGKLTDAERWAGRRYRSAYEDAQAGGPMTCNALAIQRRMMSGGSRGQGGGPDDDNPAWDEVRRLELLVARSTGSIIERGRRLLMVREVAGKGQTVRAVVGSGKAHATHMLSLAAALDAMT